MSHNHSAQKIFEDGMNEFVNHNYAQSIARLSEAIELDPEFTLAFKGRGAAYLKLDRTEEAIADFSAVIELKPHSARAYHLRGLAYEKSGDNAKALDDFNRAIEINANYGAAYFSRASLHGKTGKTEQATEDLRMVTHLTEVNLETFGNENNVWRSQQLRLESMFDDDLAMAR